MDAAEAELISTFFRVLPRTVLPDGSAGARFNIPQDGLPERAWEAGGRSLFDQEKLGSALRQTPSINPLRAAMF
jgi:hypothetical protein